MIIITIWPIFALICLGFVMARKGFPTADFWPAAERINYFVLFPALLLNSLSKAPVRDPEVLRLGGATIVLILLVAAGFWGLRQLRPTPAARFGPALQGAIRFNTYLGLAVVASLTDTEGVSRAAVYLAVAVPLVNVLSVLALTQSDGARSLGALLRPIVKNPLILACVAGIALAFLGTGLPFGTGAFLGFLAQASLPLGLLCVGAALRPATLRLDLGTLLGNAALRLLGMPCLAALTILAFGVSGAEALILLVFSAVPTAPTAYVLTRQLGGDGALMAGIVTVQTLLAVVTIPLVLLILGRV